MGKIGIMGGSFNPIHFGHLMLAENAMEEITLDEIWLIPTGCSYMKVGTEMESPENRYNMTQLAISDGLYQEGNTHFRCLDTEIKREGFTYSYETLEELTQNYPQHSFYFIVGADCLFSIELWKCPDKIFHNCHLVAALRSGVAQESTLQKKEELERKYSTHITLLPFRQLEISSTEIRSRVRKGLSIRYMVPDSVLHYIEQNNLYKGL